MAFKQNDDGDIIVSKPTIGVDRWGDEHTIAPGTYELVDEVRDGRSGESITVILDPAAGEVGITD